MESADPTQGGSTWAESGDIRTLELQELGHDPSMVHQMLLEVFEDGSGDEAFEDVPDTNRHNGAERTGTTCSVDACEDWFWREGSSSHDLVEFCGNPGPNPDLPAPQSALDFLKRIFSNELLESIARETNRYAEHIQETQFHFAQDTLPEWEPTNVNELWSFFGLLTAMKLIQVENFSLYWSTDTVYNLPFFQSVMSSQRFSLLLRFLHLSNNLDPQNKGNLLSKIMPLLRYLLIKFQDAYMPRQHLALGEAFIFWNSKDTAQISGASESASHGLKVFELIDTSNGYCCGFHVCDTRTDSLNPGISSRMVLNLMEPYFNKGYHLYIGTYCDSPVLYQDLAKNGVYACGPVKVNQSGLNSMPNTRLINDGDFSVACCNKISRVKILKNGEEMNFLTTIHTDRNDDKALAESVVEDYNQYMNILDDYDLTTEDKLFNKQPIKWWKKMFIQFFSLAQANAYILYCNAAVEQGLRPQSKQSFLGKLAKEMSVFCLPPQHEKLKKSAGSLAGELNRLTERHFIARVRMREDHQSQEKKTKLKPRACVVCHGVALKKNQVTKAQRRRATIYECRECDVGLCPLPCFKLYHTEKNYKQAYLELDPRELNVPDEECQARQSN